MNRQIAGLGRRSAYALLNLFTGLVSLVFLPVLLSYIGPKSTGGKSADESLDTLSGVDKEERKQQQRRSIYGSTSETFVRP